MTTPLPQPSRVLVTGGAGFIGSNVVRVLLARYPGVSVRVLHLPRENMINLQGLEVERMQGDLTCREDVARAVAGCDVVFHLAAVYALWLPDMSLMDRVNVGGTRNIMEECLAQGVKRVVHTSSFAVFAGQGLDSACTEQSSFRLQASHYSRSKYESHQLVESYAARGLDVVLVAPTVPVGPGDCGPTPTGRVLIDAFRLPVAVGIATDSNYVDVRDCALGHVLAYEKGRKGESYILGGENYTHPDIMHRVNRITGLKRPLIVLKPGWLRPLAQLSTLLADYTQKAPFTTPVELEIGKLGLVADASKARRELGLPTRPIEESLRDALIWFVQHGYIEQPEVVSRLGGVRSGT